MAAWTCFFTFEDLHVAPYESIEQPSCRVLHVVPWGQRVRLLALARQQRQ